MKGSSNWEKGRKKKKKEMKNRTNRNQKKKKAKGKGNNRFKPQHTLNENHHNVQKKWQRLAEYVLKNWFMMSVKCLL